MFVTTNRSLGRFIPAWESTIVCALYGTPYQNLRILEAKYRTPGPSGVLPFH